MAYGTVKVDNVTFTYNSADATTTFSGFYASTTHNLTLSGTASAATFTGTTANFTNVNAQNISVTTITGTTASFTSGVFTSLSGTTHTITSGVFASGTAALPSISFVSDPNTGVFSPGADQLAVATNGVGRLFVDASGNVGVGSSSPDKWSDANVTQGTFKGGLIGAVNIEGNRTTTSDAGRLAFWQTTNRIAYIGAERAGADNSGALRFITSNAGSEGERLRITSAGLVGIGTSSPQSALHLQQPLSDSVPILALGEASNLVRYSIIQEAGYTGFSHGNQNINLKFKTYSSAGTGGKISFWTGVSSASEKVTIDSAGNVGIGTTSPTFAAGGGVQASFATFSSFRATSGSNTGTDFAAASDGKGYIYVRDNADLLIGTNNQERARIDSSGRLLVGTSTARANFNNSTESAALQLEGTDANRRLSITGADNGAVAILARQRSGAVGGNTIVQSGDIIGVVRFEGSDGSEFVQAAGIQCEVDGTPGANDMPGRLVFSTTPDGGSSPTSSPPAMTIKSSQEVLIGTSTITANGGVLQLKSGITFPATAVAATDVNTLDDYEEGTWTPTQGAGLTVVGTFTSAGHYTKVGRQVTVQGFVRGSTSVASAGGSVFCSGLPFAVQNVNDTNFIGSGADGTLTGLINIWIDRNQAGVYSVTSSAVTASIYFTGSYFTP